MKLRTGIFIGLGMGVAALVAAPFLLPLDTYRAPLERAASRALGREVHIHGPMHLAVYPELGISLTDVSVASISGARDPEMISVESVLVGAALMPLLSRELEVTEVVLQKPVIHLEVAGSGAVNWRFGEAVPRTADQAQRTAATPTPASTAAGNVWVRNLRIDQGELSYYDARSNFSQALHDISIRLDMPAAGTRAAIQPANINGAITYNSEPLKIDGKVDNLDALIRSQPTGVHVSVASNIINADFTGSLGTEGQISGALKLGAHSVRSFAAWVGHPMPPGNGFGLVALEGQFSVLDGVYGLTHTHLAFDSMSMDATLHIDTKPDIFNITGGATIDRLDINPYLAPGASEDTAKAVKAKAANPGAPLALGWLRAANANLKLALGSLAAPNLKLDQAIVNVVLHNGVLKADLTNVTAYGGTGKGTLTVDASADTPAFHETLDLSGLRARPFLDDFMGVNRINATGAVRLDLTSRGASEEAIIKGLNGKGSIKFTDGYVSGVDLNAVARILQSVLTTEALMGVTGDSAKTSFGQMSATFTVQSGVLVTNDLALTSSGVDVNGKGTANLSSHMLEFHFEPKAKRGLPGLNLVDIGVPFYVEGPWDHPSYGPEASGLAKGFVNKLGDDARLPFDVLTNPGGTLKSLFGGLSGK
jgi:AsmA protein